MSNRLTDFVARPGVLIFLLGLLLIGHAWQIRVQHQHFDKIIAMEATIQELQQAQADRINTLESGIQNQTEILEAALGNVLPVKMSPEWERRLEELEAKVDDHSQWPADAVAAEDFMDNLSMLISELSPLSEATYFPRFSLVRWAAVAFDGLHRVLTPEESLDARADQLRAIADARPEGIVSDLEQQLRENANNFARQAEVQRINEAIQQGRTYLTRADTTSQQPNASDLGIDEVYELLGIYEDDPQVAVEIRGLRDQLQRHIAIRQAQSESGALKEQWETAKKMATTQPSVYETTATMLLHEVTATRAVLALQRIQEPTYDDLEGQLRTAVETIQDDARRRYQKWALEQVKRFQEKHGVIADRAAQDAKIFSIDNDGWSNDRYKEVQEAMVAYLLPINPALLDLPVLKRYQREFDEGWNLLDGRKQQTNVAIASSLVTKQTLHSLGSE